MTTRIEFAAKQFDIVLEPLGQLDLDLRPLLGRVCAAADRGPCLRQLKICCNTVPV